MVETVTESGARCRLRPRAFQAEFERNWTGRDIVLKPRQVGMTTWETAKDIWYFLTRRGAQVVIVVQSMSDDGALREVANKLRVMFRSLEPYGITSAVRQTSATEWVDRTRDASIRVVGAGASEVAASKKGRSGTIHRLHITELAFYEYARATLNAMLECVPAPEYGSQIVIESTPNGAAGLFFELYQAAKAGQTLYRPHFFRWVGQEKYKTALADGEVIVPETVRERELVERYSATPEQIKWYRGKVAEKGQDLVDQEYPIDEETCWLSEGGGFFDKAKTQELLAKTRDPVETRQVGKEGSRGTLRIWKHPVQGRTYVVAADPSEGVGGDPGAAVVLDRGTGEHVATIHGQFSTWEMARVLVDVAKEYAWALIVVERNNHGHAVLQGIAREQRYTRVYVAHDSRPGWPTNQVTRAAALEALHNAHREGHWSSPDRETLKEFRTFVVMEGGKPQAAPGAHDDLVMAHAVGWDVVCRPSVQRHLPEGFVP